MNMFSRKKLISASVFLFAGAFLFSSIFGSMHTFAMEMGQGAPMNVCVLIGMTNDCTMNPIEHLTLWQSFFNAVWGSISGGSAVLAFLAFALIIIVAPKTTHLVNDPRLTKQKLYRPTNDIALLSPLQEAFSGGILNPKTY